MSNPGNYISFRKSLIWCYEWMRASKLKLSHKNTLICCWMICLSRKDISTVCCRWMLKRISLQSRCKLRSPWSLESPVSTTWFTKARQVCLLWPLLSKKCLVKFIHSEIIPRSDYFYLLHVLLSFKAAQKLAIIQNRNDRPLTGIS